jgi:predicted transcriptional regulator
MELEGAIKESGKTPVEFAHSAGVSAVTVGMVKAGKPISPSSARKLLRAIKGGEDDEDL